MNMLIPFLNAGIMSTVFAEALSWVYTTHSTTFRQDISARVAVRYLGCFLACQGPQVYKDNDNRPGAFPPPYTRANTCTHKYKRIDGSS